MTDPTAEQLIEALLGELDLDNEFGPTTYNEVRDRLNAIADAARRSRELTAADNIENALRQMARAKRAEALVSEMATWMHVNLTYPGANGTDRCHSCRADLGEVGELPHKPGCYAAQLLDRAAALATTPASEPGRVLK